MARDERRHCSEDGGDPESLAERIQLARRGGQDQCRSSPIHHPHLGPELCPLEYPLRTFEKFKLGLETHDPSSLHPWLAGLLYRGHENTSNTE